MKHNTSVVKHITDDLKGDKIFLIDLLKLEGDVVAYLPEGIFTQKEIDDYANSTDLTDKRFKSSVNQGPDKESVEEKTPQHPYLPKGLSNPTIANERKYVSI